MSDNKDLNIENNIRITRSMSKKRNVELIDSNVNESLNNALKIIKKKIKKIYDDNDPDYIPNNNSDSDSDSGTESDIDSDSNVDDLDDKPNYNDKYFKSLSKDEQEKIKELDLKISKLNNYDIPLKYQILQSKLDLNTKSICLDKLDTLQMLTEESDEFHKTRTWLETLLKIPFGVFNKFPITLNNTSSDINKFLLNTYTKLNNTIYGQKSAKCQILQYISQCISNPNCAGNVIGLCGPPGCGKTTLIKEGVSKAVDRPFAFITLGGSCGANMFEGHSNAFIGSQWGNIVNILIKSKCMNPIIYMDELDKISNTSEGREIIGILTHITDPSQNNEFHDRYFANIGFDISKCLFIFSYNDESKIDPILKDRLKVIYTKGYSTKEKLIIAKKHLILDILKNIGIDKNEIIFSDDIIKYIIEKTNKEKGVRNLKRSFETIISKINVIKLNSHNLIDLPFKIENFKLPIKLTNDIINILLDEKKQTDSPPNGMYM